MINFKKGDRVYVARLGWCYIHKIGDRNTLVQFDGKSIKEYVPTAFLSYDEYDFSSDFRNQNIEEHIGKICYFWDDRFTGLHIAKLKAYNPGDEYPFDATVIVPEYYQYFRPLTDDEINSLPVDKNLILQQTEIG